MKVLFILLVWLLALPALVIERLFRLLRVIDFWRLAYKSAIPCPVCGRSVSLVGLWRCPCGYTGVGHLLRPCPNCGSTARLARCLQCGATAVLPQL